MTMRQAASKLNFLLLLLLGLSHFGTRCDARAVNVSNTWTMPQEGLNVFYRFFRDRISWFEADAVCQFHHANLVTVDNSFQFDATRDLLRELDVNDIVWIGLMRPQSSERFMWSNSRPLVTDTGYWAESLPLMDAPLCAVIDPIRDYRWHALRCGGPETASFLCEMPVPSWADACILKDMPNLTMQYMADTASIELIRNCAEEGLLRQSCKGKQDRDRAVRELICPRERLEAQRINDITNSHFKSLQIINNIRTDNNENNDIELLPLGIEPFGSSGDLSEPVQLSTEKNTVQRLIEQFNVDELMQADEPQQQQQQQQPLIPMKRYYIPGEIPKPVKKSAKKVIIADEYQKKERTQKPVMHTSEWLIPSTPKPKKPQLLRLEDMMLGDQPQHSGETEMIPSAHIGHDDDVSNEIMEPLPHKKKILPQDLKTMPPILEQTSAERSEEERIKQNDKSKEEQLEKERQRTLAKEKAQHQAKQKLEQMGETTAAATATPSATTTTTLTTTTTTSAATTAATPNLTDASTTATPLIVTSTSEATHSSTPTPAIFDASTTVGAPTSTSTLEPAPGSDTHTDVSTAPIAATQPAATIGHPMHPQQPRSNVITEETQHPHIKESPDNSHFIPPMLLVKSHYVPPLKHSEHPSDHHAARDSTATATIATKPLSTTTAAFAADVATLTEQESTTKLSTDAPDLLETSTATKVTTIKAETATETATTSAAIAMTTTTTTITPTQAIKLATDPALTMESTAKPEQTHAKLIDSGAALAATFSPPTQQTPGNEEDITNAAADETTIAIGSTTTAATSAGTAAVGTNNDSAEPTMRNAPVAAKIEHSMQYAAAAEAAVTAENKKVTMEKEQLTAEAADSARIHEKGSATSVTVSTSPLTTTTERPQQHTTAAPGRSQSVVENAPHTTDTVSTTTAAKSQESNSATSTTTPTITTTCSSAMESVDSESASSGEDDDKQADDSERLKRVHRACMPHYKNPKKHQHHQQHLQPEPTPTRNFLNEETETPPYKPNRHRNLTKPETVSYFKKILG